MVRFDVAVIGLGAAGSAVAYQLAERGVRVLGIDQLVPPHSRGSTHGDTRITRQAIGEGMAYVPLVHRSNQLWRHIEAQTGEDLFTVTGGLILGAPGAASAHGKTDFVGRTIAAANRFGIAHEVLNSDDIHARFPQFSLASGEIGYFEPGAGLLRPERCVSAQLRLAREHGAVLRTAERVLECTPDGHGVAIATDCERYGADRAVVCAGPWVSGLVDGRLRTLFSVYRQVMYWFDVSDAYAAHAPEAFPVFVWQREHGEILYGFPAVDGPQGGLKIATEQFDSRADPDDVDRRVDATEVAAMYESNVRTSLAGTGPRCVKSAVCLYTCTPDFDFVIDSHPDTGSILLVSACSGHGFKHSAAVGECVAQLLVDGRAALDLSAFGLQRFAPSPSTP